MRKALLILPLVLGVSSLGLRVDFSEEEWKERPVAKVVRLLKDMSSELQKEAETDGEMYDKLACWCETNDKEKTKAIADAEARVTDLEAAIEEFTGKSESLKVDIEKLDESVTENEKALDKATEIREKQSSEFAAEEKDMIQSISNLKGAIIAMKRSQSDSFAQEGDDKDLLPSNVLLALRSRVHRVQRSLSPGLHDQALAAIQEAETQPQSGAIFGILKQMRESFEKNLATSQSDEAAATEEYKELSSGKNDEVEAASKMSTTKKAELADSDERGVMSKQDLKDTQAQLAADTEFLAGLKKKCENMDREFEERTKVRHDEMTAVSETIGILNDDDAKDMFSKSLGFVQLRLTTDSHHRGKAGAVPQKAGAAAGDLKLIQLSSRTRDADGDPMAAVKASVDKMVEDLKKQKTAESKERDECIKDLNLNEKTTIQKQGDAKDLSNTIDALTSTIENLDDDIAALKAEVSDTQVEMKRASENREKENAEFQATIADQRATQVILAKALNRLQQFYAKKAAMLQKRVATARRQRQFGEYKKSAGAGGVVAMLESIIDDSKRVESEAVAAEQDAQTSYESFVADSNKAIKAAQTDIANKVTEVSKTDAQKIQADSDKKGVEDELQSLKEMDRSLHGECDFLLKNFEVRQASLDQEIEALRQSNSILSGMQ